MPSRESTRSRTGRLRSSAASTRWSNAGALAATVEQTTADAFDEQFAVNTKGPYFTVQRFLPLLPPGSAIVFVTSVSNEKGIPSTSVYSATKAALRSMTRTFAGELIGRGIRVNAVSPGPVDTGILQRSMPADEARQFLDQMKAANPMGRLGEPEEIARAIAFLAFEATFTTGSELHVDGGASSCDQRRCSFSLRASDANFTIDTGSNARAAAVSASRESALELDVGGGDVELQLLHARRAGDGDDARQADQPGQRHLRRRGVDGRRRPRAACSAAARRGAGSRCRTAGSRPHPAGPVVDAVLAAEQSLRERAVGDHDPVLALGEGDQVVERVGCASEKCTWLLITGRPERGIGLAPAVERVVRDAGRADDAVVEQAAHPRHDHRVGDQGVGLVDLVERDAVELQPLARWPGALLDHRRERQRRERSCSRRRRRRARRRGRRRGCARSCPKP